MGFGQVWWHLRRNGVGEVARRAVRRVQTRLGPGGPVLPVLVGDIADPRRLTLTQPERRPERGEGLTLGWLMTPPSLGSGGHTTAFRMVEGLEAAGHRCRIVLYDVYGGDPASHAAVIRAGWPGVKAEVVALDGGLDGLDACVATSWQTAHALASRTATPGTAVRRLYFAQDFEAFFYPRGAEYALAEESYRLGLRIIALGHMVQDAIREETGVAADFAPFGCDAGVYSLRNLGARSGVVMYTKPEVARRGYLLGKLALEEFHRRHPEQELHVYGDPVRDWTVPVTRHERLSPDQLNALYNRTCAGLALSFTNISLVAEEMLAAGAIPVINDSRYSRADLPNPHAVFAAPTPHGIADALGAIVEAADIPARAAAAAASVRADNWAPAQQAVRAVIEDEVYG